MESSFVATLQEFAILVGVGALQVALHCWRAPSPCCRRSQSSTRSASPRSSILREAGRGTHVVFVMVETFTSFGRKLQEVELLERAAGRNSRKE